MITLHGRQDNVPPGASPPQAVDPAVLASGFTHDVVVLSADGATIGWISPSCQVVFGHDPEPLLGRPLSTLFDEPAVFDLVRREGARGTPCCVRAGDGRRLWCEAVYRSVPDQSVWHHAYVFRDLSECQVAAPSLAPEEPLLRGLIDALPGLFWMFDERGRLLRWNRSFERVTGYRADELRALHAEDLIVAPPEVIAKALERLIAEGALVGEADLLRSDGRRIRHLFTGSIFEFGGQRVVIGTATDVSDHECAQQQARQNAILLHHLFEASPAGLVVLNHEYAVINASSALFRMLQHSPQEVLRRPFEALFSVPGGREELGRWLRAEALQGDNLALTLAGESGGGIALRMTAATLGGGDGDGSGWLLVIEEQTERRHYEGRLEFYARALEASGRRQLEAIETERRQISRELHDGVGQLLTAVRFRISSALAADDDDTRRDALCDADSELRQVLGDVRRMSGSLRPSLLDDFGLEVAIQWLVDTLIGVLPNRPALQLDIGPVRQRPDPEIETACYRIAQEALTNAVKYAGADCIGVELRDHDGGIELLVVDDGAGFDVTVASGSAMAGRSCGMLTMRERAQLVGGSLQIDSAMGRGTRIRAWLPQAPEQMSLLRKKPDDPATNNSAGR